MTKKAIFSLFLLVILVSASVNTLTEAAPGSRKVFKAQKDSNAQPDTTTVLVDTNSTIESDYLGVGVQWDNSDSYDFTNKQWKMIYDRVSNMNTKFVRTMLEATDYFQGYDKKGKPIYNWNTPDMKRLYKILDYCQKHNVTVIIGEWAKPYQGKDGDPVISASDDPRWAAIIGDFLHEMVKKRGYDVIKYYNYINEPNGSWGIGESGDRFQIWKRGVTNLHHILIEKHLEKKIKIVGPDSTGQDEWVDYTVDQLSPIVDTYDIHRYATDKDVLEGNIESVAQSKRNYILDHDPKGSKKDFFMGEAGLIDGKNEHDQQKRIGSYEYGVLMSDYILQTIRGGQAGAILWMLDDAMHNAPGSTEERPLLKEWGFWNTVGSKEEQKLRPWYYSMSLLTRYFPQSSKTVYASETGIEQVRAAAAIKPVKNQKKKGNTSQSDLSVALVNNSDEERKMNIIVPGVAGHSDLNKFVYTEKERPVDRKGYAVPKEKLKNVSLEKGLKMTLPAKSMIVLTTMDSKSKVKLSKDGNNLAINKNVQASSTEYPTIKPEKHITDGDNPSEWISRRDLKQSVKLDLGSIRKLNRVKLNWGTSYAKAYSIEVSSNGEKWSGVYQTYGNEKQLNDVVFSPVKARYIRVTGKAKSSEYGYSLREAEVYNVKNAPLSELPPPPPTSIEDPLNDWSKAIMHSEFVFDNTNADVIFEGDTSRLKRQDTSTQSVVYHVENISSYALRVYFEENLDGILNIYTSTDLSEWSKSDWKMDQPVTTKDDWKRTVLKPSGTIPEGTNYMKIEVTGGTIPWAPQISEVKIN
ncbi:discoidin domain-containing protein [Fictibacillus fluitans]|uniref:Discoidin domain-containing protein n=1 Tax=Fictibacillus fluitans TaxID=3058422 RepID=A0ABT8HWL7_9BACL|nr:discoidin domain-containing protein [Fictibacillus sp. NE201]MDN4525176.1 discoidin domain-containing protein [Fictibacillus sp. NE201]